MICSDQTSLLTWPDGSTGRRVVIVGAGTIGLYLAKLLVERGWTVRLLESGTAVLGGFASDTFASVGKPHRGIVNGRSRSIGGASNLWGGQLVEFEPHDFAPRPSLEMEGWPIPYADVARYHAATLGRLGIPPECLEDGPVWSASLGQQPSFAAGVEMFLTRWMKAPSMAVMYADDIRNDPRLQVCPGWTAVGFECTGESVSSVVVQNAAGAHVHLEADCVVIAAGTIETVRLLLAASRAAPPCPWRGNPMLGRRFQDHLGGVAGTVVPKDRKQLFRYFSTIYARGHKFQPKFRVAEGVLERQGLLGAQGWLVFESSVSEHLGYLKQFLKAAIHSRQVTGVGQFFRHCIACARHLPPLMWTYIKDHRIYVPFDSRISLAFQAEQRPCDESRITIDVDRTDSYGLPRAVLDWRVCGNEIASIRELAMRFDAALSDADLGRVDIDPDLAAGKASFVDGLYDTYHAAGGAVMGHSDSTGVVDPDLKVFGTSNLFLGSAAVLPSSSSANVTFTTLVLATRLADHLS